MRRLDTDDPNEQFDLVNAQDQVIGQVRRGDAHHDASLLHRSVQIFVFSHDGRLLLQRRSQTKDLFPGYYSASASGHVASGEEYGVAAVRETEEELGLRLPLIYLGKVVVRSPFESELTALYLTRSDGPFTFHPTETAGGAFFPLDAIRRGRENGALRLTPSLVAGLGELDRLTREGRLPRLLAEAQ